MGKIRVKTLGDENLERKQKIESRKKAQEKKIAKTAKEEVSPAQKPVKEETKKTETENQPVAPAPYAKKSKKANKSNENKRSAKYQTAAQMVDKTKAYALKEALELLPKINLSKFDETVELHINTLQPSVSVTVTLPHGTGKKVRVVIADDVIIDQIAKGKIDFDVLLAEPSMMPKLAKIARILGPRGLMPNPKNGTISNNPSALAKKFEGGQVTFKTEAKSPIMHISVGKISFGDKKLMENIIKAIEAIKPQNIKNITLKSTMSPGIKIQTS